MRILHAAALSGVIATASLMAIAQDLHMTSENGTVSMTVAAQRPYALMTTGQQKTPVLTVSCQHKGKKAGHIVTFSPGGILTEQQYSGFGNSASLQLAVNLGAQKLSTNWVAYGNVETFAYYGKTEEDRITFVQAMLNAASITIEFTPFLTGVPTSSTFDMTELRAEFDRRPECASGR